MGCRNTIGWVVATKDFSQVWCRIPGGEKNWMYAPANPHVIKYSNLHIARHVARSNGGIVQYVSHAATKRRQTG